MLPVGLALVAILRGDVAERRVTERSGDLRRGVGSGVATHAGERGHGDSPSDRAYLTEVWVLLGLDVDWIVMGFVG